MTIIGRSDDKEIALFERSFAEHYDSGAWINELSHADAIDLLMRQWLKRNDEPQNVVDVLTKTASAICIHYAELNCEAYDDEEEF